MVLHVYKAAYIPILFLSLQNLICIISKALFPLAEDPEESDVTGPTDSGTIKQEGEAW